MRTCIALLVLAAASFAAERDPAATLLRAEADAYARAATERWVPGVPVAASADGGVVGWLSVRINVWFPELEGDMASLGETVSLDDELGLGEEESTLMPQITVSFGGVGLRFDFFQLEYDANALIQRQFEFGGITFDVAENVASRVVINNYRLLAVIPIVKTKSFQLSTLAGVSYYELEGEIISQTAGQAQEEGDFPIPVLGLMLQVNVSRVTIEVEVSGLAVDYGDVDFTLIDATASIGITVAKVIAIRGGYRIVIMDGTVDDFLIDVTLEGPFVGASFQF
ncbi:MAG: hypothetical protein OER88_00685 [Planctomycetota bacterium]|nr:hypothetical protein [Planctomycetota bacterium]